MPQDRKIGKFPLFRGDIRLSDHSSLRKLMRAARRGKLPEERLGTIERAEENAAKSFHLYLNRPARERALTVVAGRYAK